jgi:hypothetical protein
MRLLLQGHHSSSSSSLALAVRWSLLLLLAGSGSPALCCYTRIFSFGDSLTDTGNYVRLTARSPSPYGASPYGRTFFSRPSPPAARATAASSSTSSVGSQSELMTLPSTDERKKHFESKSYRLRRCSCHQNHGMFATCKVVLHCKSLTPAANLEYWDIPKTAAQRVNQSSVYLPHLLLPHSPCLARAF